MYGLDLNEVKDDKMGKIILLTSKIPVISMQTFSEAQKIERRILFLVLSIIQMKGGELLETPLLNFLSKLGFDEEANEHFSDLKKFVGETLVNQMYLKRSIVKLDNSEEEK